MLRVNLVSNFSFYAMYVVWFTEDVFYCGTELRSSKMTVTPGISINDGNLVVHGKTILTGVHDNIVLTPGSGVGLVAGTFIGATASDSKSLHVFPIGVLE
jgi:hypothetical protein